MDEENARTAMLVRAIELEDAAQAVWSRDDRQSATEAALREAGGAAVATTGEAKGDADFVARRAQIACAKLASRHPEVARAERAVRWPRWLWWLLPLIAFALGLATNELGADRRINIISFPLLGVLAWNAAVYAFMIAAAVAGLTRQRAAPPSGPLTRLMMRLSGLSERGRASVEPLERGLDRYTADWLRLSSRLNGARARAILHSSAALLACGAVAGMYVRGIGLEYLAGWESTFLTEHSVHRMLSLVLGAASALSGIPIPAPEHLASLRWSPVQPGESAAGWIHLYALTAVFFVVLPRLALALFSALSARRLRQAFVLPLETDPYWRRLIAVRHGKAAAVRVVPYSYTPDARAKDALRDAFAEIFDGTVHMSFDEAVPYGGEDDYADAARFAAGAPDCLVVLFSIAATPEGENHGVMIGRLRQALREQGAASRMLIVVNESPYRQRLAGQSGAESRLAERRDAWQAMLHRCGVEAVLLDVEADDAAAAAKRIQAAMSEPAPAPTRS